MKPRASVRGYYSPEELTQIAIDGGAICGGGTGEFRGCDIETG